MATPPRNALYGSPFPGSRQPRNRVWRSARSQQTQGFRPPFSTPRQVNSPLNPLSPAYHPRQLGAQDSGNQENPATPPAVPTYALHDQYAQEYPPLGSAFENLEDSSSPRRQAQSSNDHGADSLAFPRHQAQASEDHGLDLSQFSRHQAPIPEQHGFNAPPFLRHQPPQSYEQHRFDSPPVPSHHAQPFEEVGLHAPPFAQQQFPPVFDFDPFHGSPNLFQAQTRAHGNLDEHVPTPFRAQLPTQGSVDEHSLTRFRATALPHPRSFPPGAPPPFGFDRSTSPSVGIQGPLYSSFGSREPPGVSQDRPDIGFHPDVRPVSRPFTRLTIPPPGLGFETPGRNPDSYNPRILPLSDAPQTRTRGSSPPLNAPTEPRALRLVRGSSPVPSQRPSLGPFGDVVNQPIPYPLASYSAAVRLRSGAAAEQELLRGRREGYRRLLESVAVEPVPIQNAITFSRSEEDQSTNTAARLEEIVYENERLNPEAWTTEYDDPVPARYQPDFDFHCPANAPGPSAPRYRSVGFIPTTPYVPAVLHHTPSAPPSTVILAQRTKGSGRSWSNKKCKPRRPAAQSHAHPEPETALALQDTPSADQSSPSAAALLHEARLKTTAALASALLARGMLEIRRQDRCEAGIPLVGAFLKATYPTLSHRLRAAFAAERTRVSLMSSRYLRYIRDVVLKESDVVIEAVQTAEELTWLLVGWEESIERATKEHGALLEGRKEALRDVWGEMGVDGGEGEMEMAMNVAVFGGVEREDVPPYMAVFA